MPFPKPDIISLEELLTVFKTEYPFDIENNTLIIDVRSEGEYAHAHIPGAVSIPIFNNKERKEIGTAYKQQSRAIAIKIGLDYFGRKMNAIIESVESLIADRTINKIIVHCWRGGMRSAAFTWLLRFYGFDAVQLEGGYKSYRKWAISQFEIPYKIVAIGGKTGSAKTEVLQELRKMNHLVIDLELLALHRGSAFGALTDIPQPSQEQFENKLALELYSNRNKDENKPIFLEDESRRIGNLNIPGALWTQIRAQEVWYLDVAFDLRLEHIIAEYKHTSIHDLIRCTDRIKKKLGGDHYKITMDALNLNDFATAFDILLRYYDKYYAKGLESREQLQEKLVKINTDTIDPYVNASKITSLVQ